MNYGDRHHKIMVQNPQEREFIKMIVVRSTTREPSGEDGGEGAPSDPLIGLPFTGRGN